MRNIHFELCLRIFDVWVFDIQPDVHAFTAFSTTVGVAGGGVGSAGGLFEHRAFHISSATIVYWIATQAGEDDI